jgi:Zn-dependent protease with chaperone function
VGAEPDGGPKRGAAPADFLSTHPSDKARIEAIRELIPEAMEYYDPVPVQK